MNVKERLSKRLGVEEGNVEAIQTEIYEIAQDDGEILSYYFQPFNSVSGESGCKKAFARFKGKIMQVEKQISNIIPVLYFETRNQEEQFKGHILKKEKAPEKKYINTLLSESLVIYEIKDEKYTINLMDEGINYLEHEITLKSDDKNSLKGVIHNISLLELYNLYNVTGDALFKDNVRIGVSHKRLISIFEKMFMSEILSEVSNRKSKYHDVYKCLAHKFTGTQVVIENNLDLFWFRHNGITIYSIAEFEEYESIIKFNPNNISIVNGAQTVTNCFNVIKSIREEILASLSNLKLAKDDEEMVRKFSNDLPMFLLKSIIVKCIFIQGPVSVKKDITIGLNTQVPINEKDIAAFSEAASKLNEKMRKFNNMRIARPGELTTSDKIVKVDQFLKGYFTYKMRPGYARNYPLRESIEKLEEINSGLLEDELPKFLNALANFQEVDAWWRLREYDSDRQDLIYNNLHKNGNYYFKSYLYFMYEDVLEDGDIDNYQEFFQTTYTEFLNEFCSYYKISSLYKDNPVLDSNTLKSDVLFKEFKFNQEKNIKLKTIEIDVSDIDFLVKYEEYLKENSMISKSSKSHFIKKILKDNNLEIGSFRTYTFSQKNNKFTEEFSFSSKTFKSLYEIEGYPEVYNGTSVPVKFEDSEFKKELEKDTTLFIFVENANYENSKIIDIIPVKEFNFKSCLESAMVSFMKTIEAFNLADTSIFPSISDDEKFHVRTKARDSSDTFEFTDGNEITKLTFWANRSTIMEILKKRKIDPSRTYSLQ